MGEAKRRKQKLGSGYGLTLGLSTQMRRNLITKNISRLISNHFETCGYDDYINSPLSYQNYLIKANSDIYQDEDQINLDEIFDEVIDHWQNTFTQNYDRSFLELLVLAILENQPIILKGENSFSSKTSMKPVVTLPEARKYFQALVLKKKVKLSHHYTLIQDALIVLAKPISSPLLKQLLWGEFRDVIEYAESENLPWLEINFERNNEIGLSENTVFQGVNCALAGILTTVATLPWQIELSALMSKSE
jgi:hypothetical protein